MPLLANIYPQTNWGGPPEFRAAPIEELVGLRMQQQQRFQNELLGAINQYKNDQIANQLTQQYEDQGMVPQGAFTGGGVSGAAAAQDYIKNQQYRMYDVNTGDIGGTVPMTAQQRAQYLDTLVRANAMQTIANQRYGGGGPDSGYPAGSTVDPSGLTNDLGYYLNGVWRRYPSNAQPGITQGRQDQATQKRLAAIQDDLDKNFNINAEDFPNSTFEFGTANPDPNVTGVGKAGRVGTGFTPTPVNTAQPWVRVTTPDGTQTIMRRSDFNRFQKAFPTAVGGTQANVNQAGQAQNLPGFTPTPSLGPSGAGITPTPIPSASPASSANPYAGPVNTITPHQMALAQAALMDPNVSDADYKQAQFILKQGTAQGVPTGP